MLSFSPSDIVKRVNAMGSDQSDLFNKYTHLVAQHTETTRNMEQLRLEIITTQRETNQLQSDRFHLLTTHLHRINQRLGATYRRVVPQADCYLSYAHNPISLFEDGVAIIAQHASCAWREVGGWHMSMQLMLITRCG